MLKRLEAEYPSQITFTSDFHELVNGNLKPGMPLRLSYDPRRIVSKEEQYIFGDPHRPVMAHVQFGTASSIRLIKLTSPGMSTSPNWDNTGHGSMLKANVEIPVDAQMISIWFSFLRLDNTVAYDSDYGTNFNFRFPECDLTVLGTNVVFNLQNKTSIFSAQVSTNMGVDKVTVRFGRVDQRRENKDELPLRLATTTNDKEKKIWEIDNVVVPTGVVISFKIFYWIGGVRFKDDNTGHYYLSPPHPPEKIPPPPPELERAVMAWK